MNVYNSRIFGIVPVLVITVCLWILDWIPEDHMGGISLLVGGVTLAYSLLDALFLLGLERGTSSPMQRLWSKMSKDIVLTSLRTNMWVTSVATLICGFFPSLFMVTFFFAMSALYSGAVHYVYTSDVYGEDFSEPDFF